MLSDVVAAEDPFLSFSPLSLTSTNHPSNSPSNPLAATVEHHAGQTPSKSPDAAFMRRKASMLTPGDLQGNDYENVKRMFEAPHHRGATSAIGFLNHLTEHDMKAIHTAWGRRKISCSEFVRIVEPVLKNAALRAPVESDGDDGTGETTTPSGLFRAESDVRTATHFFDEKGQRNIELWSGEGWISSVQRAAALLSQKREHIKQKKLLKKQRAQETASEDVAPSHHGSFRMTTTWSAMRRGIGSDDDDDDDDGDDAGPPRRLSRLASTISIKNFLEKSSAHNDNDAIMKPQKGLTSAEACLAFSMSTSGVERRRTSSITMVDSDGEEDERKQNPSTKSSSFASRVQKRSKGNRMQSPRGGGGLGKGKGEEAEVSETELAMYLRNLYAYVDFDREQRMSWDVFSLFLVDGITGVPFRADVSSQLRAMESHMAHVRGETTVSPKSNDSELSSSGDEDDSSRKKRKRKRIPLFKGMEGKGKRSITETQHDSDSPSDGDDDKESDNEKNDHKDDGAVQNYRIVGEVVLPSTKGVVATGAAPIASLQSPSPALDDTLSLFQPSTQAPAFTPILGPPAANAKKRDWILSIQYLQEVDRVMVTTKYSVTYLDPVQLPGGVDTSSESPVSRKSDGAVGVSGEPSSLCLSAHAIHSLHRITTAIFLPSPYWCSVLFDGEGGIATMTVWQYQIAPTRPPELLFKDRLFSNCTESATLTCCLYTRPTTEAERLGLASALVLLECVVWLGTRSGTILLAQITKDITNASKPVYSVKKPLRALGARHRDVVTSFLHLHHSGYVCSSSLDGEVRLWDKQYSCKFVLHYHALGVSSMAYSRDSLTLFTAGHDGVVAAWSENVWSAPSFVLSDNNKPVKGPIVSIKAIPQSNIVIAFDSGGTLRFFDTRDRRVIADVCAVDPLLIAKGIVRREDLRKDVEEGAMFVTAAIGTAGSVSSKRDLGGLFSTMVFTGSVHRQILIGGSHIYAVVTSEAHKTNPLMTYDAHRRIVHASMSEAFGVFTAAPNELTLWSLKDGLPDTRHVNISDTPITSIAYRGDGDIVLVGQESGAISAVQLSTGTVLEDFKCHDQAVSSLSLHMKHAWMVSACTGIDSLLCFWYDEAVLSLESDPVVQSGSVRKHPFQVIPLSHSPIGIHFDPSGTLVALLFINRILCFAQHAKFERWVAVRSIEHGHITELSSIAFLSTRGGNATRRSRGADVLDAIAMPKSNAIMAHRRARIDTPPHDEHPCHELMFQRSCVVDYETYEFVVSDSRGYIVIWELTIDMRAEDVASATTHRLVHIGNNVSTSDRYFAAKRQKLKALTKRLRSDKQGGAGSKSAKKTSDSAGEVPFNADQGENADDGPVSPTGLTEANVGNDFHDVVLSVFSRQLAKDSPTSRVSKALPLALDPEDNFQGYDIDLKGDEELRRALDEQKQREEAVSASGGGAGDVLHKKRRAKKVMQAVDDMLRVNHCTVEEQLEREMNQVRSEAAMREERRREEEELLLACTHGPKVLLPPPSSSSLPQPPHVQRVSMPSAADKKRQERKRRLTKAGLFSLATLQQIEMAKSSPTMSDMDQQLAVAIERQQHERTQAIKHYHIGELPAISGEELLAPPILCVACDALYPFLVYTGDEAGRVILWYLGFLDPFLATSVTAEDRRRMSMASQEQNSEATKAWIKEPHPICTTQPHGDSNSVLFIRSTAAPFHCVITVGSENCVIVSTWSGVVLGKFQQGPIADRRWAMGSLLRDFNQKSFTVQLMWMKLRRFVFLGFFMRRSANSNSSETGGGGGHELSANRGSTCSSVGDTAKRLAGNGEDFLLSVAKASGRGVSGGDNVGAHLWPENDNKKGLFSLPAIRTGENAKNKRVGESTPPPLPLSDEERASMKRGGQTPILPPIAATPPLVQTHFSLGSHIFNDHAAPTAVVHSTLANPHKAKRHDETPRQTPPTPSISFLEDTTAEDMDGNKRAVDLMRHLRKKMQVKLPPGAITAAPSGGVVGNNARRTLSLPTQVPKSLKEYTDDRRGSNSVKNHSVSSALLSPPRVKNAAELERRQKKQWERRLEFGVGRGGEEEEDAQAIVEREAMTQHPDHDDDDDDVSDQQLLTDLSLPTHILSSSLPGHAESDKQFDSERPYLVLGDTDSRRMKALQPNGVEVSPSRYVPPKSPLIQDPQPNRARLGDIRSTLSLLGHHASTNHGEAERADEQQQASTPPAIVSPTSLRSVEEKGAARYRQVGLISSIDEKPSVSAQSGGGKAVRQQLESTIPIGTLGLISDVMLQRQTNQGKPAPLASLGLVSTFAKLLTKKKEGDSLVPRSQSSLEVKVSNQRHTGARSTTPASQGDSDDEVERIIRETREKKRSITVLAGRLEVTRRRQQIKHVAESLMKTALEEIKDARSPPFAATSTSDRIVFTKRAPLQRKAPL